MASIVYGGLDVHRDTIVVCLIDSGTGRVVEETLPNERSCLLGAVRRWGKLGMLQLCYEASGAGFVVQRWLAAAGVFCEVIAPSKVWRAPGERIKTDRRDACKLAQQYAAGLLTVVRVPSEEEEQVRRLLRLREELTRDATRLKNRIVKQLALLGIRYRAGKNWTQRHRRWLQGLELSPLDALVLRLHLEALGQLEWQQQEVDEQIATIAQSPPYREGVQRLMSLRGIGVYSAMVLLSEIGDIRRFGSARQLMSYFGLVPGERSSGDRRRARGITKTGNTHARWVLGQAAWNQRHRPGSQRLRKHWRSQPAEVVVIARRAEQRLHRKFWQIACRKEPTIAATAVAREMAGFVWALLSLEIA